MWERLKTGLTAIAVLGVCIIVLLPEPPPSMPTTLDIQKDGLAGLKQWLDHESVETVSYRHNFNELTDLELSSKTGNLLVTTMPFKGFTTSDELRALTKWVESGNTVLILAAINEIHNWSMNTKPRSLHANIRDITGGRIVPIKKGKGFLYTNREAIGPETLAFHPNVINALTNDVGRLAGITDQPARLHTLSIDVQSHGGYSVLAWIEVDSSGQETTYPVMWSITREHGHILLSTSSSLLSNRAIGIADNRKFVQNLLHEHVAKNGTVLLDDYHQGVRDIYDVDAFWKDKRLYASMGFLVLLWFLYIIGTSPRIAPVREHKQLARQEDFVKSVGGFFARKLSKNSIGRLIISTWLKEIETKYAYSSEDVWMTVRSLARDTAALEKLQTMYEKLELGYAVDLTELNNLILQVRESTR